MLRREKAQVLPGGGSSSSGSAPGGGGGGTAPGGGADGQEAGGQGAAERNAPARPQPKRMGRKTDLVVWLRLAPLQRHIYEAFLNSDAVRAALNSTRRWGLGALGWSGQRASCQEGEGEPQSATWDAVQSMAGARMQTPSTFIPPMPSTIPSAVQPPGSAERA
jgi:hypothetical protein